MRIWNKIPNTSAKIRIRIIPTKRRGCCAIPRTPASPTIPIAKPAAKPDRPTERPAPRCLITAIAAIPVPDFAVPYAAPNELNTMADAAPSTPKNGA
ncbi:U3 snoRNP protein [Dermatophagoides pteronyssinus]|uniref:U3 snoRNP protein n=1 Tax=Dermatophagoides pteronyssinus TaxID=6956 RepID=A0ABQ8JAM7_DERPT|nr:U3 snoRNP protein [Dermatophagoides pteronyssinus]